MDKTKTINFTQKEVEFIISSMGVLLENDANDENLKNFAKLEKAIQRKAILALVKNNRNMKR